MVELTFGEEMVDSIISSSELESGGVYTTVGTYNHTELVTLVVALSGETDLPVEALVEAFGNYLFGRFLELFPIFFSQATWNQSKCCCST